MSVVQGADPVMELTDAELRLLVQLCLEHADKKDAMQGVALAAAAKLVEERMRRVDSVGFSDKGS